MGDPHRPVDQVAHLTRHSSGGDIVGGDILEQRLQVDFLLVACADGGARLLANDSHDRYVIHLRVVQTVQQMDRPWTGGRIAKPDLAGELGMGGGHEGGHFLVPHLDVVHEVLGSLQRDVEAADAVAGIAVHTAQPPFIQAVPNEFADVHATSPECDTPSTRQAEWVLR